MSSRQYLPFQLFIHPQFCSAPYITASCVDMRVLPPSDLHIDSELEKRCIRWRCREQCLLDGPAGFWGMNVWEGKGMNPHDACTHSVDRRQYKGRIHALLIGKRYDTLPSIPTRKCLKYLTSHDLIASRCGYQERLNGSFRSLPSRCLPFSKQCGPSHQPLSPPSLFHITPYSGKTKIMPRQIDRKRPAADGQTPATKRSKTKGQGETLARTITTKRVKATLRSKTSVPANTSVRRTARASFQNTRPNKTLRVFVFGEGSAGELGLGSKKATDVATPRLNPSLDGIVSLATGGMHAVALTADNKVLTWGVNDNLALGRDTTWDGGMRDVAEADADDSDSDSDDTDLNPREATPTAIPSTSFPAGTQIVQVAAGDSATFMLTRDGLVYGCGTFRDLSGDCGFTLDPATDEKVVKQATPCLIPNLKGITSISVGADYALALDSRGHVFAWGSGQQHQLGYRIMGRYRHPHRTLIPHRVELPSRLKLVSIHAGIDHAFAIDADGNVWAWGLNNFGQTGVVDNAGAEDASVTTPTMVPALAGKNMRTVHGGRHHSIGITKAGECLVWGRMDGAQMGLDISQLPIDDPTKVTVDDRGRPRILLQPTPLPLPKCIYADAGPDHCIAVTQEGKAYSWGFNVNHQCGQGTDDDILVAKLINGKAVRDMSICWAGAGGQYSMLASHLLGSAPLTNGTFDQGVAG